ncbi:hypothetical protein [Umezawaea sp. NPDC059074]|uniref:hypothetical protein n=1 Tax=Umezawaea sp. NPDC059074 TaxID=3346716 RepID=UPI00368F45B0
MPAQVTVGSFRKHKGTKVVVLEVGLTTGGANAVRIAPISTAKPRTGARAVKAKTWVDDYYVLLDQATVVEAGELADRWTGPSGLKRDQMAAVEQEWRR